MHKRLCIRRCKETTFSEKFVCQWQMQLVSIQRCKCFSMKCFSLKRTNTNEKNHNAEMYTQFYSYDRLLRFLFISEYINLNMVLNAKTLDAIMFVVIQN